MKNAAPSILITDDDRAFRNTLESVFQPRGFTTFLAADGEEAIRIVRQERIHLVLLDMHMPRLTGVETMRVVKSIDAQLPCILISGGLDEEIRAEAQRADAFSVLEKPVQLDVVTHVVAEALRTSFNWRM